MEMLYAFFLNHTEKLQLHNSTHSMMKPTLAQIVPLWFCQIQFLFETVFISLEKNSSYFYLCASVVSEYRLMTSSAHSFVQ